jgi:hypothetical protein
VSYILSFATLLDFPYISYIRKLHTLSSELLAIENYLNSPRGRFPREVFL